MYFSGSRFGSLIRTVFLSQVDVPLECAFVVFHQFSFPEELPSEAVNSGLTHSFNRSLSCGHHLQRHVLSVFQYSLSWSVRNCL